MVEFDKVETKNGNSLFIYSTFKTLKVNVLTLNYLINHFK